MFLKEKLTINLIIAMFFALLGVIFSVKGEIEVNKFVFIALLSVILQFRELSFQPLPELSIPHWHFFSGMIP
ncbi:hypothetical protein [Lebetimonas sp. JH292]|uniref:hypothetical protein n=1 Tax=Lebetimonas sp. JH292 TaxID=990068 RepID=UPI0035102CBD